MFIKEPVLLSMDWADFVRPYSPGLWCCLLGFFLALGATLRAAASRYTLLEAIFLTLAGFLFQGNPQVDAGHV